MDRFDLAVHGEPVSVLRRTGLQAGLVIGVASDLLFPLDEQRAIAQALEAAGVPTRFVSLPCLQGHDSFLIDLAAFGREISAFLDRS
jgi:homoserine acetyltransferase